MDRTPRPGLFSTALPGLTTQIREGEGERASLSFCFHSSCKKLRIRSYHDRSDKGRRQTVDGQLFCIQNRRLHASNPPETG